MKNRGKIRILREFILVGTILVFSQFGFADEASSERKPNILFIAVDDLRPELGCYGPTPVQSPHIDRLARSGMLFDRAYCQQAVCAPSRASLMTGLRPDTLGITDLSTFIRDRIPDVVTLPQNFIQHGYQAEAFGKIYHVSHGNRNDELSWTAPWWNAGKDFYVTEENQRLFWENRQRSEAEKKAGQPRSGSSTGPSYENADKPDSHYVDWKIADRALSAMRRLHFSDTPFFLAVGFVKPHLPFVAPQRYWDLYDPEAIEIPENDAWPADAPLFARTNWGELRNYVGIPPKGPLDEDMARKLIHGYYACVSFVDAQVGRLLDELEALGIADNTIVVLWGDHGFKIGEFGAWCKHTNFELDTRVPLIVSAPQAKAKGGRTKALVELLDIYPTLCELAGIAAPPELEGRSFAPLLDEPDQAWKPAAFSQYPRRHDGKKLMGYSLRSPRYRYTEWRDAEERELVERELYDLQNDELETENIAKLPGSQDVIERLQALMAQTVGPVRMRE